MSETLPKIKPFLKWPGGKFRLLDEIKPRLPDGRRLIEPFAGSGAIFLNTYYKEYWLNDINQDLITLFEFARQDPTLLIEQAETFFNPRYNDEKTYYKLRSHFNQSTDTLEKSALFIYLNRHGYNGLCRYNQKGEFNVPFGRYKNPSFPKQQLLTFANKKAKIKLTQTSFESVLTYAKAGDIVYCDPPYAPLNQKSNFTQYHQRRFSMVEQQLLADIAETLQKKGVYVMISNHNTPDTRRLYANAKLIKLTVPRTISCVGHNRVAVKELLAIYD